MLANKSTIIWPNVTSGLCDCFQLAMNFYVFQPVIASSAGLVHRSDGCSVVGIEARWRKKFPNLSPMCDRFSEKAGIPPKSESTEIKLVTDSMPVPSVLVSSPSGFGGTFSSLSSILKGSS